MLQTANDRIPSQFVMNLHGKQFVQYVGLLALAHEQGLESLEAEFLQVTPEMVTAKATARFEDGRIFSDCGEATPTNVPSQVRPHFARMALTRAKARALRDALNISMVTIDETSDMGQGSRDIPNLSGEFHEPVPDATPEQIQYLSNVLLNHEVMPAYLSSLMNHVLPITLDRQMADSFINEVTNTKRLPNRWFIPYVGLVRTEVGMERADVVAYLKETFGRATPKDLSHEQQSQLMAWLTGTQAAGGGGQKPADDVYQPAPAKTAETHSDQNEDSSSSHQVALEEWIPFVDTVHQHTQHEFADIEAWLIGAWCGRNPDANADTLEVLDIPIDFQHEVKQMTWDELGKEIDLFLGQS
jgi:hypothetical protein